MSEKVQAIEFTETRFSGFFTEQTRVEGNVIHDVSLLGAKSSNGRIYTRQAMEDAAKLYNGVQVFANHPSYQDLTGTGGRKFEDLAGKIMNTRLTDDRVRGDVVLISDEPIGEKLKRIAGEMPDIAGFSHRASGEATAAEDGTQVIERITEVFALEIVVDPATTKGLFESRTPKGAEPPNEEVEMDLKGLTAEQLKAERPEIFESIGKAAVEEAEKGSEVEQLRADLKDAKTETEGFKTKLDAAEAVQAEKDRKAMVETKLEKAELPETMVTDHFREQLDAAKDEKAVDALIEDRKTLAATIKVGPGAPKSKGKTVEGVIGGGGDKTEKKPVTDEVVESAAARLFS